MDSISFQQYICNLDPTSLPRVVKICSGVYFQGSVYEILGSECCLSTGDLMKIVDVQLQKVTCENMENGHMFDLPQDFKVRNGVVKIDSTLDVEVVDVTEESRDVYFIKPLMLSEVLLSDHRLPVEAEILEAPELPIAFQSDWVSCLSKGCRVHIHSKGSSRQILASSQQGKKGACHYFLLSSSYKGTFRRCPRKFSSTTELALSLGPARKLQVVVTKDHNSSEEMPLFTVGDRLRVLSLARADNPSGMDMLVCCRDNGEEEEEEEQVRLPLFLEAGFVEDLRDNKKYTLSEVVQELQLPCEVKVVPKDAADPLGSVSILRLEAQIKEHCLLVSLANEPSLAFEIPPKWMDVPLFFTEGSEKPSPPTSCSKVEELSEAFYYHLLKLLPSNVPPPPRPPKRRDSKLNNCPEKPGERKTSAAEISKPPFRESKSQESAKTGARQDSLRYPNQYTIQYGPQRPPKPTKPCFQVTGTSASDDSDHDYEELCEEVQKTVHKLQRASIKH
ncbi:protein THEMIS2 isoform X2 [Hemicordylus capensis]|uniref:protein THEMIS2 isoform X2 n=1 Tax=Hemicordylus capensis TaxID=884348 RepID=UPI002304BD08|nr:protein THEMIS2 isoform X2 [Hemicordylus capensis]